MTMLQSIESEASKIKESRKESLLARTNLFDEEEVFVDSEDTAATSDDEDDVLFLESTSSSEFDAGRYRRVQK